MIPPLGSLAVPIATGVAMALLGPFGGFDSVGLAERLLFWVPSLCAGAWLVAALMRWLAPKIGGQIPLGWALLPVVVAFLAWAPVTALVWLLLPVTEAMPSSPWDIAPWVLALLVLLALLASMAERGAVRLATTREVRASLRPTGGFAAEFRARLPSGFPSPILCLTTAGDQLRVIADGAETTIPGDLAEATRSLEGLGLRVHRAWWVAFPAISAVEGETLVLTNGDRVPIGRTFRAALLDALS